jgi:thioredoxin-related protein
MRRTLLATIALAGLAASASAQPATKDKVVPATSAPQAVQPISATPAKAQAPKRADIYDEKAEARAQLAAALKKAKKENRRVLVQWGANWCGWCHLLHGTFATDAKIKTKLRDEYDVVLIDVGQFKNGSVEKNADLAKDLGAELAKNGLPFLTILDSDGKPLANQETSSLELTKEEAKGASGHNPAKVLAFLTEHQAPPADAEAVLSAGMAEAQKQNKRVFLHFGAPWCGWCHKLEDWMARPDIEPLLAKDFYDLKIDTQRMTGGDAVAKRTGATGGIPWFAIIDPKTGEKLTTSDGPDGNIGFPAKDEEIAHFMVMLEKAAPTLTKSDRAHIEQSLRKKDETGGH